MKVKLTRFKAFYGYPNIKFGRVGECRAVEEWSGGDCPPEIYRALERVLKTKGG